MINPTILNSQISAMLTVLRTFDLEEEYCAGHIKRTGEFYSGSTFVVGNLWFNFRLIYRDLAENPWRVGLHIVADDHTSTANVCMCPSQETLIEYLEGSEAQIAERIDKLAGEEKGFYWE